MSKARVSSCSYPDGRIILLSPVPLSLSIVGDCLGQDRDPGGEVGESCRRTCEMDTVLKNGAYEVTVKSSPGG